MLAADIFARVSSVGVLPKHLLLPLRAADIFARHSGDFPRPLPAADIFSRALSVCLMPNGDPAVFAMLYSGFRKSIARCSYMSKFSGEHSSSVRKENSAAPYFSQARCKC